jgi:histidine triad (HIT) family protein
MQQNRMQQKNMNFFIVSIYYNYIIILKSEVNVIMIRSTNTVENCIFCKIIKGEIPCSKIYEDKYVIAFLDIGPVNKGHTLVIPKVHYETLFEIPDANLAIVAKAVKKVGKAVMLGTHADGLNVLQNNYKDAGQLVSHAHFHLIPRFKGDGFKHWPQSRYNKEEIEEYKAKIAKLL